VGKKGILEREREKMLERERENPKEKEKTETSFNKSTTDKIADDSSQSREYMSSFPFRLGKKEY